VETVKQQLDPKDPLYVRLGNAVRPLSEWCDLLRLPYRTVYVRVSRDWDPVLALIAPVEVVRPRLAVEIATGAVFGSWTVVREAGRDRWNHVLWRCVCRCGAEKDLPVNVLHRVNPKCRACAAQERAEHPGGLKVWG
jgi:hypothetical protein